MSKEGQGKRQKYFCNQGDCRYYTYQIKRFQEHDQQREFNERQIPLGFTYTDGNSFYVVMTSFRGFDHGRVHPTLVFNPEEEGVVKRTYDTYDLLKTEFKGKGRKFRELNLAEKDRFMDNFYHRASKIAKQQFGINNLEIILELNGAVSHQQSKAA